MGENQVESKFLNDKWTVPMYVWWMYSISEARDNVDFYFPNKLNFPPFLNLLISTLYRDFSNTSISLHNGCHAGQRSEVVSIRHWSEGSSSGNINTCSAEIVWWAQVGETIKLIVTKRAGVRWILWDDQAIGRESLTSVAAEHVALDQNLVIWARVDGLIAEIKVIIIVKMLETETASCDETWLARACQNKAVETYHCHEFPRYANSCGDMSRVEFQSPQHGLNQSFLRGKTSSGRGNSSRIQWSNPMHGWCQVDHPKTLTLANAIYDAVRITYIFVWSICDQVGARVKLIVVNPDSLWLGDDDAVVAGDTIDVDWVRLQLVLVTFLKGLIYD